MRLFYCGKIRKKLKVDIICNNDIEVFVWIFRCKYYYLWGLLLIDYGNILGCLLIVRWSEENNIICIIYYEYLYIVLIMIK